MPLNSNVTCSPIGLKDFQFDLFEEGEGLANDLNKSLRPKNPDLVVKQVTSEPILKGLKVLPPDNAAKDIGETFWNQNQK